MEKWENLGPPLKDSVEVSADSSGAGKEYRYRKLAATVLANLPLIGEPWEDTRRVTTARWIPGIDNSGYDEVVVSTRTTVTSSDVFEYEAEKQEKDGKERIVPTWERTQIPLNQHPKFIEGGQYDLYTTPSVMMDVMGWEAETNPEYKANRKYRKLDSDGVPSGAITTVTNGSALAYIKLRQKGFDSCDVYLPIITRISTYRGTYLTEKQERGLYVLASKVEALSEAVPAGFQWIKTRDDFVPIGNKTDQWERTEVWNGYVKVYFDAQKINPAGNTIA